MVDSSKVMEIIKKIADEAHSLNPGDLGINEITAKMRNVFASAFGIDLSMNNAGLPVFKTSLYRVEEIDTNGEPFELAMTDLTCGLVVIVDLTEVSVN